MDILYNGLQVTVIGMGVVFGVLFVLSLLLQLFEYLFYREKEDGVSGPEGKSRKREISYIKKDDEEEIAVISAVMSEALEKDQYVVDINRVN
ncbi:MAG: OadG family protein [Halanaerobiales bacterium]